MYILSILLAIVSGVFYHLSQKNIPTKMNPILSLIITFSIALFGVLVWYVVSGGATDFSEDIGHLHWSSLSLGVAIVGLELGVMLAYRSGWRLSNFNIFYTFSVTMMLLPIGIVLFKESVSGRNALGILITIIGIVMMKL